MFYRLYTRLLRVGILRLSALKAWLSGGEYIILSDRDLDQLVIEEIASRLISMRSNHGLTRQQVAEATGLDFGDILLMESGRLCQEQSRDKIYTLYEYLRSLG